MTNAESLVRSTPDSSMEGSVIAMQQPNKGGATLAHTLPHTSSPTASVAFPTVARVTLPPMTYSVLISGTRPPISVRNASKYATMASTAAYPAAATAPNRQSRGARLAHGRPCDLPSACIMPHSKISAQMEASNAPLFSRCIPQSASSSLSNPENEVSCASAARTSSTFEENSPSGNIEAIVSGTASSSATYCSGSVL